MADEAAPKSERDRVAGLVAFQVQSGLDAADAAKVDREDAVIARLIEANQALAELAQERLAAIRSLHEQLDSIDRQEMYSEVMTPEEAEADEVRA